MRKYILSILIVCGFTLHVNAQSSAKRESIKTLLGLMQQGTSIDKYFENLSGTLYNQMAAQYPDSANSAKIKKISANSIEMGKKIAHQLINEDMVAIYDKNFTEAEIKELIRFYESPAGKALVAKLPDIQRDVMAALTEKYMPEMQAELMKQIQELTGGK
jgi:hypothetical protein